MKSELKTAHTEFDDVSARMNTLSSNKDKLDLRRAEIEDRRAALAAERVNANLKGEAFTKAADLRGLVDEVEGINDALGELNSQIDRVSAEFSVKSKTLRQLNIFDSAETRIEHVVAHVAKCQQAFQTGMDLLRVIHGTTERIELELLEVGVSDTFPATRLRNRLGDRLARLFAKNLGGVVYGNVIYNQVETIEGNEDWEKEERAVFTRELKGVENGLRLGLIGR